MPTLGNLYDQVAASGAGLTPAAGDVPFLGASGALSRLPGVGMLRTKYAWSQVSPNDRRRNADTDILSDDGNAVPYLGSSLVITAADLQTAGNTWVIQCSVHGWSHSAYAHSTYNLATFKLKLSTGTLLTVTQNVYYPLETAFYWDVRAAIEIDHISSGTNRTYLHCRLGPVISSQAGPATAAAAGGTMNQMTLPVDNTADRTLALTLATDTVIGTQFLHWENVEAFVWQMP
jgi:hypothetical protein